MLNLIVNHEWLRDGSPQHAELIRPLSFDSTVSSLAGARGQSAESPRPRRRSIRPEPRSDLPGELVERFEPRHEDPRDDGAPGTHEDAHGRAGEVEPRGDDHQALVADERRRDVV